MKHSEERLRNTVIEMAMELSDVRAKLADALHDKDRNWGWYKEEKNKTEKLDLRVGEVEAELALCLTKNIEVIDAEEVIEKK